MERLQLGRELLAGAGEGWPGEPPRERGHVDVGRGPAERGLGDLQERLLSSGDLAVKHG